MLNTSNVHYNSIDFTRDSNGNFYSSGYWEEIERERICAAKRREIQQLREKRWERWKAEEDKIAAEKAKEERLQEDIRMNSLYGIR